MKFDLYAEETKSRNKWDNIYIKIQGKFLNVIFPPYFQYLNKFLNFHYKM